MDNFNPVITDRACPICGLCWLKNHQYGPKGAKKHVGYYHRCGASASGLFDGKGDILRVNLQMSPEVWSR